MRDVTAEALVLLGAAQEVDDLRQLRLRLVDAGDVGERDAVAGGLIAASLRPPEGTEHALHVAGTAHEPEEQREEEQRRAEAEQQVLPPRRARIERHRVHDDALPLE